MDPEQVRAQTVHDVVNILIYITAHGLSTSPSSVL